MEESSNLCCGLNGREQVCVERPHLRVAGIVLAVLDPKDGVVRHARFLGDLRQLADAPFELGDDRFEEV